MLFDIKRATKIVYRQFRNYRLPELIKMIFKSLFKVDQILIYSTDSVSEIAASTNHDILEHIKKGDSATLEHNRKICAMPYWEFSMDLYDGVRDFFYYEMEGVIGHISWIYYKNDPNRIIKLGNDESEIKYSLTLPQFRGKGIYPATLAVIQRYLINQGYKRIFICVKQDNQPSIRGIIKAGFSFTGKIKLIKLLGIQVSRKYDVSQRKYD